MQDVDNSKFKIGEAAKCLGVSIDTLRRWEKSGKIKTVKSPGGTRFYPKVELARVKSQKSSPNHKLPISQAAKQIGVSVKTLRRWDKAEKLVAERDFGGHRVYNPRSLFRPSVLRQNYFLNRKQTLTSLLVFGAVILGIGAMSAIGLMVSPFSSKETAIKPQVEINGDLAKVLGENNKKSYIYNDVGNIQTPPVPQNPMVSKLGGEVMNFDLSSFNTVNLYPKVSNTNIEYINQSSVENLHLVK